VTDNFLPTTALCKCCIILPFLPNIHVTIMFLTRLKTVVFMACLVIGCIDVYFLTFSLCAGKGQLGSHTSQSLTSSVIILNSVNSHSSEVNVCVMGWPNLWKNVCVNHVHRNTRCVTCTGCCYGVVSCSVLCTMAIF
jgi:hypothetical protein